MKMNMNSDLTFITNEKNQTLLDRFRMLICTTIKRSEFERFMNKAKTK